MKSENENRKNQLKTTNFSFNLYMNKTYIDWSISLTRVSNMTFLSKIMH